MGGDAVVRIRRVLGVGVLTRFAGDELALWSQADLEIQTITGITAFINAGFGAVHYRGGLTATRRSHA